MITKICIISGILGIILLIFISNKLELPISIISKITDKDLNKTVKIKGTVSKFIEKESLTTIELEEASSKINVILFKSEKIQIKKGNLLEVEGKVAKYENKLQIYADTIKVLN